MVSPLIPCGPATFSPFLPAPSEGRPPTSCPPPPCLGLPPPSSPLRALASPSFPRQVSASLSRSAAFTAPRAPRRIPPAALGPSLARRMELAGVGYRGGGSHLRRLPGGGERPRLLQARPDFQSLWQLRLKRLLPGSAEDGSGPPGGPQVSWTILHDPVPPPTTFEPNPPQPGPGAPRTCPRSAPCGCEISNHPPHPFAPTTKKKKKLNNTKILEKREEGRRRRAAGPREESGRECQAGGRRRESGRRAGRKGGGEGGRMEAWS